MFLKERVADVFGDRDGSTEGQNQRGGLSGSQNQALESIEQT